jgi:hypothetical protein
MVWRRDSRAGRMRRLCGEAANEWPGLCSWCAQWSGPGVWRGDDEGRLNLVRNLCWISLGYPDSVGPSSSTVGAGVHERAWPHNRIAQQRFFFGTVIARWCNCVGLNLEGPACTGPNCLTLRAQAWSGVLSVLRELKGEFTMCRLLLPTHVPVWR